MSLNDRSHGRSSAQPEKSKTPAVFLDRDGTLIDDIGYLADPEGIRFYPGIPDALRKLKDEGYLIVVVTNQSGIGRGYFDEETALAVNCAMIAKLGGEKARVDAVYYCPHHPDDRCSCRKPGLLMIERAAVDLEIDLGGSWIVGDVDKDVKAGIGTGLAPILVETGKGDKGEVPEHVLRCESVVQAADFILGGARW